MTTPKPGLLVVREIPYSPVIGHTSTGPIFRAAGARGSGSGIDFIVGDDDGDDPDFDDEDEDLDEDEDDDPRARRQRRERDDDRQDDGDDWTPPDRHSWESVQDALNRANREAMNRRKVGKLMDRFGVTDATSMEDFLRSRGIDPDSGERGSDDDRGGFDADVRDEGVDDPKLTKSVSKAQYEREKLRAEQRGAARAEAKYKDATILLAAENALRGAGWSGENLNLALRLIDPDKVDVTMDSGELTIDGLEEQVAEVKDEFPQWFRPSTKDRNVNRRRETAGARAVDGGNRERPPARKLGWAEHLSRQIDRGR